MVDALAVLRRRCGSVPQGDFVRAPDSTSIYLCSRHACKCGGIFNNEKGEEIDPGISLSQVGELVDGFRRQIERIGEAREVSDEKLLGQMRELGMEDVRVTELTDDSGRNRFYVVGRTTGQGMVLSRQVAVTLSRYFGRNIRVGMNSPSLFFDDYRMAAYEESAAYRGMYHVRRIRKYGSPVSGDN